MEHINNHNQQPNHQVCPTNMWCGDLRQVDTFRASRGRGNQCTTTTRSNCIFCSGRPTTRRVIFAARPLKCLLCHVGCCTVLLRGLTLKGRDFMRRLLNPYASQAICGGVKLLSLAGAVLLVLQPASAHANNNYRATVTTYLQMPEDSVPCATCHDDPGQGGEPRNRAFYVSLTNNGMTVGVFPSVTEALGKLESGNVDSDNDSVGDIAELKAGTNPNDANSNPGPDEPAGGSGTGGSGGSPPSTAGSNQGTGGSGAGRAGSSNQAGQSSKPPPPRPSNDDDDTSESDPKNNLDGGEVGCAYSVGREGHSLGGVALLFAAFLYRRGRTKRAPAIKALRRATCCGVRCDAREGSARRKRP